MISHDFDIHLKSISFPICWRSSSWRHNALQAGHDIESNWGAGINFAFVNDKHLLEENRQFFCAFEMLSPISIFLNKKWQRAKWEGIPNTFI